MNSVCVGTLRYITLRWGKEDLVPLLYGTSRHVDLGKAMFSSARLDEVTFCHV